MKFYEYTDEELDILSDHLADVMITGMDAYPNKLRNLTVKKMMSRCFDDDADWNLDLAEETMKDIGLEWLRLWKAVEKRSGITYQDGKIIKIVKK